MFRRTCQNCHRNYIPNSQNRDVTCLVCGKELCPNCNRNHFCPDHWNLLPTEVQIALLKLTEDAKRKQMVTFAIMAVGMVAIMLTFVLFAVNGLVFVGLGIFFGGFILLALLMFSAVFSQKGSKIKVLEIIQRMGFSLEQLRTGVLPQNQTVMPIFQPNIATSIGIINTKPPRTTKYCEFCGTENPINAEKCSSCQTPFFK